MIDIKGDNIGIIAKNPDDNILIYNIKTKVFTNIFYKGSRVEKLMRENNNNPFIINIEFITQEKLFIGVSSKKTNISTVIYDLKLEKILNFDEQIRSIEEVPLIQYGTNSNKLLAYVGIVDREVESEEHIEDLYNENENNQIEKKRSKEVFVDIESMSENTDALENEKIIENQNVVENKNLYYKYFEYLIR